MRTSATPTARLGRDRAAKRLWELRYSVASLVLCLGTLVWLAHGALTEPRLYADPRDGAVMVDENTTKRCVGPDLVITGLNPTTMPDYPDCFPKKD